MGFASTRYALGLFFIVLVTLIWSISSIVVQFLYTDEKFDSPFLLTYIGTSLFMIFLPSRLLWERRGRCCCCCGGGGCCRCGSSSSFHNHNNHNEDEQQQQGIIPWTPTTTSYEQIPLRSADAVESFRITMDDDEEVSSIPQNRPSKGLLLSHREHLYIALKIAPVWFISNYTYNASLKYTSITSSTVLASTGSVFTFLFAIVSKDERFTILKLVGVLLGVLGSALTGWSDFAVHNSNATDDHGLLPVVPSSSSSSSLVDGVFFSSNNATFVNAAHAGTPHHFRFFADATTQERAILGDLLGLVSAMGYGTYTVMIRVLCPHDEDTYSMQLLLGYIGLVNCVSLLPIALYVLLLDASSTTMANLTWIVFGYLVAKGMLDNVLSDYLWARAVVLTSATVATVGLGLTIPLAFLSDWFMGHENVANVRSICGAASVLIGFILVNIGYNNTDGPVTEAERRNSFPDLSIGIGPEEAVHLD